MTQSDANVKLKEEMVGIHRFYRYFCEECNGKFHLKGNILNIIHKTVKLAQYWVLKHFKYQRP